MVSEMPFLLVIKVILENLTNRKADERPNSRR